MVWKSCSLMKFSAASQSPSSREVKKWYDGYLFNDFEIYNPWSILKYVNDRKDHVTEFALPYWSNTSSNSIVPIGNGVFIYRCNLNVRNLHFQPEIVADRPLSDFLQVAREKQEVPKIILRLMNIAVGDVLMRLLFYRAAVNQSFQDRQCFAYRIRRQLRIYRKRSRGNACLL